MRRTYAGAGNAAGVVERMFGSDFDQTWALVQDVADARDYTMRSEMVNAIATGFIPQPGQGYMLDGVPYMGEVGANAIPGLPGLVPSLGIATPFHWGARPTPDIDATAAVQAAFDWARTGYNSVVNSFLKIVSLAGGLWRVRSGIQGANIRQPGFTIDFGAYGGLYADFLAPGGAVLDLSGTNSPKILGLVRITTNDDEAKSPHYAILRARARFGTAANPIAPNHTMVVYIDGKFSRSAFLNYASEVSKVSGQIYNRHSARTARCYVGMGHQRIALNLWGEEVVSTHPGIVLPTLADGFSSNILHDLTGCECKRPARYNAAATITKGATTTVTFTNAVPAGVANGDRVKLSGGNTFAEIEDKTLLIADLNPVTRTFTAKDANGADINSSAWAGNGGSPTLWAGTGTAITLGSIRGFSYGPQSYILTYCDASVELDLTVGTVGEVDLQFQQENSPEAVVRCILGHDTGPINFPGGFRVNIMSTAQRTRKCALEIVASGNSYVVFKRFRWDQHSLQGEFEQGFCNDPSRVHMRAADVILPRQTNVAQFETDAFGSWEGVARGIDNNFVVTRAPMTRLLASAELGYDKGAGGYIQQLTNKSTGVTLNKPCGSIEMHPEPLAAGAKVTFFVTNSFFDANDLVVVKPRGANSHKYIVTESIVAGGFYVTVKNDTGGSLGEPLLLNFIGTKSSQD